MAQETVKTPLMATLLAVARAVQNAAQKQPKDAAPYFMVAYNAILDMMPEAAVWLWQIIKFEERFDEHKRICKDCKPEPDVFDCSRAVELKCKLMVYRARLAESETWVKNP